MHERVTEFVAQRKAILCCPRCGGDLASQDSAVACLGCRQPYPVQDGIPQVFWRHEWEASKDDVTDRIKAFYEDSPFPNYDDFDSVASLIDKARRGLFAKLLDDQIPFGSLVLECGCGTGQLTNFLSVASRTVIGTDLCLNSLRLAEDFRRKNRLERAHFLQMNLFRPCFRPGSFDLVICNGVLHHTSDPRLGFQSIANLVRPGGYLLVGLYHRYGRLATDVRRALFHLTGARLLFLDRHAVDARLSRAKRDSWFKDQYRNPHESKHTLGEVLGWMETAGFSFVRSIPSSVPFTRFSERTPLFEAERAGSRLERFPVAAGMVLSGHREGGLFVTIARKHEAQ